MSYADFALVNGVIHTMTPNNETAQCLAAKNGRIIHIGDNQSIRTYINEHTHILNVQGHTVLPGLIESHVHAPGNAYNALYNINLFDAKNEQETMDTIKTFIDSHPERKMYYGRGFMSAVFPGIEKAKGPKKERLDAICPDKAVVLIDFGGHLFWLNSKALEIFGITEDTPAIEGGIIEKDPETGALWGTLKDEAKSLVHDQTFTLEEQIGAFQWFQDLFTSHGYTTVMSMRPSACSYPNPIFEAADELRKTGKLKLRFFGAREIKPQFDCSSQLEELDYYRRNFTNELIHPKTAKFFVDGTVEGVSAWLSEPYTETAGKGIGYCGTPIWDPDEMADCFVQTLKQNFQIHAHCIGDMAVTKTIDALEYAQMVPGDHRNVITHLQLIKPEDIKRMHELKIIACINAVWHYKDPYIYFDAEMPFLGKDRAEKEYPLASLVRQGVTITCAADHPITPDPNPFHAIQVGVTRNRFKTNPLNREIPAGKDPYLLNKDERVSVLDMVKAYTINSAYALHAEKEIGSLEVGKYADLVVLDRDIFTVPAEDIAETLLLHTVFNGQLIYSLTL